MGYYILIVTGSVFSFVYFLNASWNNFYKFKSANYQIAQCSFSASSAVCWIISEILAAKLKINTKYILYFTHSRPAAWWHCKHFYITSNINTDQYKHKYSIYLTLDKSLWQSCARLVSGWHLLLGQWLWLFYLLAGKTINQGTVLCHIEQLSPSSSSSSSPEYSENLQSSPGANVMYCSGIL